MSKWQFGTYFVPRSRAPFECCEFAPDAEWEWNCWMEIWSANRCRCFHGLEPDLGGAQAAGM